MDVGLEQWLDYCFENIKLHCDALNSPFCSPTGTYPISLLVILTDNRCETLP